MVILDAGPLVALFSPRDEHHAWAVQIFAALTPPLWTCEAVLGEAAYLTGKPIELMDKVSAGVLRIGLDIEEQSDAIIDLLSRYGPGMDLADAGVVRMSEIFPESKVLTLDRRHFSFYRRNKRNVIPLIAPAR